MQTARMKSAFAARELQTACPIELLDKDVGRILTTRRLLLNSSMLTKYRFCKLTSKQIFQEIDRTSYLNSCLSFLKGICRIPIVVWKSFYLSEDFVGFLSPSMQISLGQDRLLLCPQLSTVIPLTLYIHAVKVCSYINHETVSLAMAILFCGEGPRQQKLRTHRSLKAYCATLVMKMNIKVICFFHFSE
jgi:hypothetical protein